ncbi:MAG TPA: DUF3267 domain-containing protein, partial [Longilinea sp.]|nr:DUF3267 domain-containing protein [Longilinea sp.]
GYVAAGTFNLNKNMLALVVLNVVALVLLGVFSAFFSWLIQVLRPDMMFEDLMHGLDWLNSWTGILMLIGSLILMVILHEGLHGLFFWFFTRAKPRFAFRGAYAYAALEGWYFPRRYYAVISMAPLVGISLLAVILFAFTPVEVMIWAWAIAIFNGSGAVGDLAVTILMLFKPAGCLIEDQGDKMTFYAPGRKNENLNDA